MTRGMFRGCTVVGNVDGVCVEPGAGHTELVGKIPAIPSRMIIALETIDATPPKPQVAEETDEHYQRLGRDCSVQGGACSVPRVACMRRRGADPR